MDAMRRDHTTPTGFPAATTAPGMVVVMLEKQHGQWYHLLAALCPLVIVKWCSRPALDCRRMDAQMGENGGKTKDELPPYASCACLACCLTSLAPIQCEGPPGEGVKGGRLHFKLKSAKNNGCYTKG